MRKTYTIVLFLALTITCINATAQKANKLNKTPSTIETEDVELYSEQNEALIKQIKEQRKNYKLLSKEDWEPKPQFTVDANTQPNFWHTLEHTKDDTLFWNNVVMDRMIILIEDGYTEEDIQPFLKEHNIGTVLDRSMHPDMMNYIVVEVLNPSPESLLLIIRNAKE